jgi:chromosomal replication initiation ATPase DnaA
MRLVLPYNPITLYGDKAFINELVGAFSTEIAKENSVFYNTLENICLDIKNHYEQNKEKKYYGYNPFSGSAVIIIDECRVKAKYKDAIEKTFELLSEAKRDNKQIIIITEDTRDMKKIKLVWEGLIPGVSPNK